MDNLFRPGYGKHNKMVRLCKAMAFIQQQSPVKGKYRRHGERRLKPEFAKWHAERANELAIRRG